MAISRFAVLAVVGLLTGAACTSTVPVPPPVTHRPAVVRGELRPSGHFRAQAVSLTPVALVQAEIGGPGLSEPLVASAAVGSDHRFVVPFANVPLGDNRPVRVVGFAASGRAVPGVVLEGWLTVRADSQQGETSAAATPVGETYRKLWQLAQLDPLAGVIAQALSPASLQAHVTTICTRFGRDYSLIDGDAVADALVRANRTRSAYDLSANGVSLPPPDGGQVRHPATVRGTLWGLAGGETITAMAVDDPLSPPAASLPTAAGTPFHFYPVVPGLRQLTTEYSVSSPMQRYRHSRSFVASADTDTVIDVALPSVTPRQAPPGATVTLRGAFLGASAGSASIRQTSSQTLNLRAWGEHEVSLTLPESATSGPAVLEISGADWGLEVEPFIVLAGPPVITGASVVTSGSSRQLQVSGSDFSAYGRDHRLRLVAANGAITELAAERADNELQATLPANLTSGSYRVELAIGGIEATDKPTVNL